MSKVDELFARIERLEARVVQLEARPAAPARKAIPAPRDADGGVRILTGTAAGEPAIVLPSDAELRQLRAIVDAAYPHLRFVPRNALYADADRAEDWRGFVAAFAYLAEQGRAAKVDLKRATSWHVDGANAWLRERGRSAAVSAQTLMAALIAHGDIEFTDLATYPSFALTIGGAGRRYAESWREVLATGRVLKPVADPRPRQAPPSPAQLLIVGDLTGYRAAMR